MLITEMLNENQLKEMIDIFNKTTRRKHEETEGQS